eukprot:m.23029 g.23029  ORF g.23029 m.23029 type:complete len:295 (-) comp3840_c0_seq1:25-909(-)
MNGPICLRAALVLVALCGAAWASNATARARSTAACPLAADTAIAVYAALDAGGVGDNSHAWTRRFFEWFSEPNPSLTWVELPDPQHVSRDCVFTEFPSLKLYVQPGGDAYNQSISLGPAGRDNILEYVFRGGHYMGTCAGFYYAVGAYWWFNEFLANSFQAHWFPTVEGPIREIATYPEYAPTAITAGSASHTMLYWGGPASGLHYTTPHVPGSIVASFNAADNTPAGVQYGNILLWSPHPEAVEGMGISCPPPHPAGCLTAAQRLQNWQLLARQINELLSTEWIVPSSLGAHV